MSKDVDLITRCLLLNPDKPLSYKEIVEINNIKKSRRKRFLGNLHRLVKIGKIIKTKDGKYELSSKTSVLHGIFSKKGRDYFLETKNNLIHLPGLINNAGALIGDSIAVKMLTSRRRITSKIVKIFHIEKHSIIGYMRKYNQNWYLYPIDRKVEFIILIRDFNNLSFGSGYLVLADIIDYPDRSRQASGRLVKVYGSGDDENIDKSVAIDKFDLPYIFNQSVEKQLLSITLPNERDFNSREDFRGLETVTIDGIDAKDFDDAVDVEKKQNGYKLYVHIADVSYYVEQSSAIDIEAFNRGFSVYFPGSVIPMLPEKLSNNICSLVPDEDRLSLSVIIDIDKTGSIKKYRFAKSVIRNKNRLNYRYVQGVLENREDACDNLKSRLILMNELAHILRVKRFNEGSLDLNIPQAEFVYKNKMLVGIKEKKRIFAYSIIEEFMLMANICAADFLDKHLGYLIRRVHEKPDMLKIAALLKFLRIIGHNFKIKNDIKSKDLSAMLDEIKDDDKKKIISMILLRSLKRAEYSLKKEGHFALNFDNYTHFTSPIRRYPDLIIHRLIKTVLEDSADSTHMNFEYIVDNIKKREVVTEKAEFYMKDIKAAGLIKKHIGDIFTGVITSVISAGFFVRLDDIFAEGFVPIATIDDDYYEFIEDMFMFIGKNTRKMYKIGDKVSVSPVYVDKYAPRIDLKIIT